LGGEKRGHEGAELDWRAISDEVDLSPLPMSDGCQQALTGVGDVATRGEIVATVEPDEGTSPHGLHKRRQDRRIASAPDEVWTHDHGLQLCDVRRQHALLGQALSQRVEPKQSLGARPGLIDIDERTVVLAISYQYRLGADVDETWDASSVCGRQHVFRYR
jgi:hypothetical protein